ncbi:MAG: hypothetical protein ACI9BF_000066 [Candidatus Paceibacteria bacterium]|jgi:hypothetical protein
MGTLLASIGAAFIALTLVFDKLTLGDFYKESTKTAWFVSSVLGSVIGLTATFIGWLLFSDPQTIIGHVFELVNGHVYLLILSVLVGTIAALALLSYFYCFATGSVSTTVGIVIAATPIFVFVTQKIFFSENWLLFEVVSVVLTVIGILIYEWLEKEDLEDEPGEEGEAVEASAGRSTFFNLPVITLILFSTFYLVLIDWVLSTIVITANVTAIEASFIALPFYWLGFGVGIINLGFNEVRSFLSSESLRRVHFIFLIFAIEIIGAGFYFFEQLAIAELDVTLATLIIGAHVVAVWIMDIYIRNRYQYYKDKGESVTKVFFFRTPTESLIAYDKSRRTIFLQLCAIGIVLTGLALWP